jgi:hypothetical protein
MIGRQHQGECEFAQKQEARYFLVLSKVVE